MNDETTLIKNAQNGNVDSLSQLIDRYLPFVNSLALRITGNKMDADDITQETMIKVFKKIKRFRHKSSLKTWIYRITINNAYKTMNQRKKQLDTENLDAASIITDQALSPLAGVIQIDQKKMLKRAIDGLPRKQKMAVLLRIEHEMAFKEIAKVMKRSEGAVKANYFHGIHRIKDHFKRSGHHE